MAELTAATVKYGTPAKTSIGDLFLTITRVEFPASAEAVTGGVELDKTKLGLTIPAVAGADSAAFAEGLAPGVGTLATTTGLPIAVWTSGAVVEASTAGKKEAISLANPCVAEIEASTGKIFLKFFVLKVATVNEPIFTEGLTANKAKNLVAGAITVFVLGK